MLLLGAKVMELNADFKKRVVIHSDELDWVASPTTGVHRRMFDRIGGEVARATSIVRYAPGSEFPMHVHGGGEEFVVLEGVFQDEYGDYPVGSYVRNPPSSRHSPRSDIGCTIFVKLWQFDLKDRKQINIAMHREGLIREVTRENVSTIGLFSDHRESVRLELWAPNAAITFDARQGAEFLVLDGSFEEAGDHLRYLSWLRIPIGGRLNARTTQRGAKVWVKTGHLRFVMAP
jgi:anti-sigma factor ChrR (cupin superfamily)